MSEGEQSFIRRTFARGHAPDLVARAIVEAATRNRAQVAVGWDTGLVYRLVRVTRPRFTACSHDCYEHRVGLTP